jgi:CDK-activating kinase assembly factor MAT1
VAYFLSLLIQESGKEGSAARVIAKTRAEALKRNAARAAASSSAPASQSKLLRSRAAIASIVPDVPHEPLTDDWYAYDDQFVLRTSYNDPSNEAVRADREGLMRAGGYRTEEAWERAIRMAVAGLEIAPLQGTTTTTDVMLVSDS